VHPQFSGIRQTDDVAGISNGESAVERNLLAYLPAVHANWLATEPTRLWREIDGSLVFADVSGFTPLTERLARRGKVGAEDLTDALNGVFCELLAVAGGFGGDCLKFGGDALLLLFGGDGHARRAAAAAFGMLVALRPFRRLRTEAGVARLDMSVGVHTGKVHLFLAGSAHRELVAAGPGVTRALEMEAAANAGQILLSPEAAAQLDERDLGEALGPGRLLIRRPAAPPPPTMSQPTTLTLDARRGIPGTLIDHLAVGRQEGEHRLAAIGFLQFGHSDQLVVEAGAEALAGALDSLIGHIQSVCLDHDVTFLATDVDKNAGKVILATGTPVASSDDGDRLLRALHQIVEGPQVLPVRAGANQGRIFSVDVGSSERRCFTVMGDAVNLTARVMGKAEWGGLLATSELLGRVQTRFHVTALEPFLVKGKSEPVSAQKVGAPQGVRDASGADLPLIGRKRELAVLREALASAHEGEGRIVELIGEAGLGKSRLVRELVGLPHWLPLVTFEAGKYSRATPYFALQRAFRRVVGAPPDGQPKEVEDALRRCVEWMAPNLAPWLPLIGVPLGLDLDQTPETARLDPTHRRATLQNVVIELLDGLLPGPILLVIQDSHWLDDASAELTRQLAAGIGRRPWAIVITRRDVPEGLHLDDSPVLRRLELAPLAGTAAASLASAVAGEAAIPPYLLEQMVERSGGNPLFLQELVAAASTGAITELPDSVDAVMAASIDTLGPEDRMLLRRAAVLGSRFQPGQLAGLLGVPTSGLAEHLRRLEHFLFQDETGTLRFRHGLIRDVAYEGLPFRTRRELHGRAAALIEATAGAHPETMSELLALHWHQARRYDASWRYSRLAGERAQRNAAPVEAAAFFSDALEAGRQLTDISPADLSDVAERLGDVYELGGRYNEATVAYRQARRLAREDRLRLANLYRKDGWVREREGRLAQGLRYYRRAFSELDQAPEGVESDRLRASVTTACGAFRLRQGRHQQAIPLLEEAAARAEATGDQLVLADAYRLLDWAHIELGTFDRDTYREQSLAIYEELEDQVGQSKVLNNMGIAAYYQGRWDDSVTYYERSSEAASRAGDLLFRALVFNNIAEIRSDQGHLQEAEDLLNSALNIWRGARRTLLIGLATSNMGRVAARFGRLDEAANRLRTAREIFQTAGASSMLLEADARDAERLVFAAEPEAALEMAADVRARTERFGGMPYVLAMLDRLSGYAACQQGDPKGGYARLEASLDRARGARVDYEIALTLEAMTRVGPLVDATGIDVIASEAEEIFHRLGVVSTLTVPLSPAR
jgi:class 3 adenylate cyclase/tetratricopeptide (TPR) repeat protein